MSIYQHFRDEEQPFIDMILEWKEQVLERYSLKRTDFLDPRQQDILLALIGKHDDVRVSFFGGSSLSERKRALIYPQYIEVNQSDFQLLCFELDYAKKFVSISHRDVLGALLSLGLKRDKFGDILFNDTHVQVIVASEISDYIALHLESVGKTPVQLQEIPLEEIIEPQDTWMESHGTVSSLRLDAVLSEVYHQSRSKMSQFIENGFSKVNWQVIEKPSYELQAGDYLSLKGFGRSKIISVEGMTKKGKTRIVYGILK